MMRFQERPAPPEWDDKVLNPGRRWLEQPAHRDQPRPKDLWSPYREDLARAFSDLCAYTVMFCPNGTVDHYVPWSRARATRPDLAYQWSNLRYAEGWFNSSRKSADIPDPFTVCDDWFELLLPSLELVSTDAVPQDERERVAAVLTWLGKHPRVIKLRREYFRAYRSGELELVRLDAWAPLLARALRARPEFLLPGDR